MGLDNKYGEVTTERGDIGEDEPVVVFRAQDGLLPELLEAYRAMCREAGSPRRHLDLINDTLMQVRAWQADRTNRVLRPPLSGGPAGQAWALRRGFVEEDGPQRAVTRS
jgi:hypothetical protein